MKKFELTTNPVVRNEKKTQVNLVLNSVSGELAK